MPDPQPLLRWGLLLQRKFCYESAPLHIFGKIYSVLELSEPNAGFRWHRDHLTDTDQDGDGGVEGWLSQIKGPDLQLEIGCKINGISKSKGLRDSFGQIRSCSTTGSRWG